MTDHEKKPAWMEDELVRNIPPEKLDFLCRMFEEANRQKKAENTAHSQKEMLLRLMPLLKQMKTSNLNLTPSEMQAAVAAVKKHSTPEEVQGIENILKNGGRPPL